MKKITTDWHIHTEYSCDDACMRMADLIADQRKNGITDYGVTDHLHWLQQEEDICRSRQEYDRLMALHPELKGHFHFGVEASVMAEWDLLEEKAGIVPRHFPLRALRQIHGSAKNTASNM